MLKTGKFQKRPSSAPLLQMKNPGATVLHRAGASRSFAQAAAPPVQPGNLLLRFATVTRFSVISLLNPVCHPVL